MIYWRNPPKRNKTIDFIEWLLTVALVFTVGGCMVNGIKSAIEKPTPPVPDAVIVTTLKERRSSDDAGYNLGQSTVFNDGQGLGGLMVLIDMNGSNIANTFILANGDSYPIEGTPYIIQAWYGDLLIWGHGKGG